MLTGETIAAPITAPGVGAVAVVRVSGPKTREILGIVCENGERVLAEPRTVQLVNILDVETKEHLDNALVTLFIAPNSYTGEDSAEFSLHGSSFIVRRFIENLHALGVRSAKPGEFTERAYLNGKLDLAQAEAVQDLILAESEAQARVAREQLEGRLSGAISKLGSPLRELLAQIEAYIDFPEEDIDPLNYSQWGAVISEIVATLEKYIGTYSSGRLHRDGASVVLVGLPNAGKSSLLNVLVGDERAIVTPVAGTTRDSIEERITIEGLLIRLWDTAGIAADTSDQIEQIGIEQSWKRARSADLILFLYDLSAPFESQSTVLKRIEELGAPTIFIGNKSDLANSSPLTDHIAISAKTGAGISELKKAIAAKLVGERRESILITSERHVLALKRARGTLEEALGGLEAMHPPEFISVSIRAALVALEEIVGVTTTDEILGLIFSKFCIGK